MADTEKQTREVLKQKVTAERNDAFVVFHVGMRINSFWKIHRWLPIILLAPRMVRELVTDSSSGLLGSRVVVGPGIRHVGFIQYWESFDSLESYARDETGIHHPAWQDYYQNGTKRDAALGIWHETYLVEPDSYETIYNNMPTHGLGACDGTEITSASNQRKMAAGRLGRTDRSVSVSDEK